MSYYWAGDTIQDEYLDLCDTDTEKTLGYIRYERKYSGEHRFGIYCVVGLNEVFVVRERTGTVEEAKKLLIKYVVMEKLK